MSEVQTVCDRVLIIAHGKLAAQGTPEELAARLAARGVIAATAQGSKEAVLAAAATVPGLTDLRVTAEKADEISFTAASIDGSDQRAALSAALAAAGCPVLSLQSEQMSLEDVFLQLTETEAPAEETAPAEAAETAEDAMPRTRGGPGAGCARFGNRTERSPRRRRACRTRKGGLTHACNLQA